MAFVVDREARRTFDPERGLELFFGSSGSSGTSNCEIVGENVKIVFSVSRTGYGLTQSELVDLGIKEGCVWFVHQENLFSESEKIIISDALITTKMAHGFSVRGESYFVRFKKAGELYNV